MEPQISIGCPKKWRVSNIIFYKTIFQENPACTKNDNRDKVLLTAAVADQKEENKKYRQSHHQTNFAEEDLRDMSDKAHRDQDSQALAHWEEGAQPEYFIYLFVVLLSFQYIISAQS